MFKNGERGRCGISVVKIGVLLLLAVVAAVLASPAAQAAETETIITLPWANKAKRPVMSSTTVEPKQSRWGCLSCHSSPRLSKIRDGKEVSLFIDQKIIGNSMHKKIRCLDCHTDFSYDVQPALAPTDFSRIHPAQTPVDFSRTAGLACVKCHPYQEQLYKKSIHGQLALANKNGKINGREVAPPTCSDCHGNHDVKSPRFEPNRSKFRGSVRQGKVCVKCHQDRYKSWNDYYHGRAYKNGAKDAPVCWDCHNNHDIQPVTNPKSTINDANLSATCGRCHAEPTSIFTSYSAMIHNRTELLETNPIMKLIRIVIPAGKSDEAPKATAEVSAEPGTTEEPEGLLSRIIHIFFPESLRPNKP